MIELPDGRVIRGAPDPTAEALLPILISISNQLDLLVRLSCGQIDPDVLKVELDNRIKAAQAKQNGH